MLNHVLNPKDREALYDDIRQNCNVSLDKGIYIELNLNYTDISHLKTLCEDYILKTLKSYYVMDFKKNNFLVKYRDKILHLPNRAPSGAFYPKVENVKEYNKIQSFVNDILNKNNLVNQFKSFDLTTVRVVDGQTTDLDSRVSSTTRLHSDAWAGHDGDAILTIGLLGDKNTSTEFNKIIGNISPLFYETQPDYVKGLQTFKKYEHISNLKFDNATIFDHTCLHRTLKTNGGLRVSIDIGITLKSSDGVSKTKKYGRTMKKIKIKDILKIGKETIVEATETLEECRVRFKDDKYDKIPITYIHDTIKIG
jgi:hypothetical protein